MSSSSSSSSGAGTGGGSHTRVESFTVKMEDEEIKLRTKLYMPAGGEVKMEVVLVLVYRLINRIMQSSQEDLAGLASALAGKGGCWAVTFDMRGIGRSTGYPSLNGSDEVKDVIAVCKWAAQKLFANNNNNSACSSRRIVLVGCSAGAAIAGSALDPIREAVGCVAISYPFGLISSFLLRQHHKGILSSKKQVAFIMGAQDWFTSESQLKAKVASATEPKPYHIFKQGKGHCPIRTPEFVAEVVKYILHTFMKNI